MGNFDIAHPAHGSFHFTLGHLGSLSGNLRSSSVPVVPGSYVTQQDMFLTAAPVNTDIGRSLMHKMGWKQGEGLGKNKEGALNPLLLEIKTDRQGLVAAAEKPKKKGDVSKVIRKDLSGKHPVMALNELCNKKRWGKPNFEVVREDGPAHRKNFVFKVRIRNEEYIPTVPSANKKDAKALAATVALQKMGLLMS